MKKVRKLIGVFLNWRRIDSDSFEVDFYLVPFSQSLIKIKPILRSDILLDLRPSKLHAMRTRIHTGHLKKPMTFKAYKEKNFRNLEIVGISKQDNIDHLDLFLKFLTDNGLPPPKWFELCKFCISKYNLISIITPKTAYEYFGNKVCYYCALEEIKDDFRRRGLEITESTNSFITQQLRRTKSVDKTVDLVTNRRSLVDNIAPSLFDVIPADNTTTPVNLRKWFKTGRFNDKVPENLIKHWEGLGYTQLLPAQLLALNNGLLDLEHLLVVAGTSSGKTFIAEIAGLTQWIKKQATFIFLTPLVALTNQKYEDFKKKYRPLGARVSIRVGMTQIEVNDQDKVIVDGRIKGADIIVATYEAFDWILRSGEYKKISNLGLVVIDEVQLLGDEERGQELDGIIARTKLLFPHTQIIALSATIGNSQELAEDLEMSLVEYNKRPVAVERYITLLEKDEEKISLIADLIKKDSKIKSKEGYFGKSLVFTNSRRRTQEITVFLRSEGIRVAYYHAGLTYYERKRVESRFEKGEIDAIVTTAALGAGIDFPISQVILERPAMGVRWLTVAEFYQMLGRAGRFGYHSVGKVHLLLTPGSKIYAGMNGTEDTVGFDLLVKEVEPIDLNIDFQSEAEQVLAFVATQSKTNSKRINLFYEKLVFETRQIQEIIKVLNHFKMIRKDRSEVYLSLLGRATAESFLTPKLAYQVAVDTLNKSVLDVALSLTPFESLQLSSRAHARLEQTFKARVSTRFFNDTVLELISGNRSSNHTISKSFSLLINKWIKLFFDCQCKENPYCEHPQIKASKLILNLRMKEKLNPVQINNILIQKYDLMAYPGDLFAWLETVLHSLESISKLATAMKKDEIADEAKELRKEISQARGKRGVPKGRKSRKRPQKSIKSK